MARGMSDLQLRDEVMTLLLAGHETTANTLAWTLVSAGAKSRAAVAPGRGGARRARRPGGGGWRSRSIALHPDDADGSPAARTRPPGPSGARHSTISKSPSYRLRAGTNVIVSQWVLHRNPRIYPDPERFDPERWREDSLRQALPAPIRLPAIRSRSAGVRGRELGAYRVRPGARHTNAEFPVLAGIVRAGRSFSVCDAAPETWPALARRSSPVTRRRAACPTYCVVLVRTETVSEN